MGLSIYSKHVQRTTLEDLAKFNIQQTLNNKDALAHFKTFLKGKRCDNNLRLTEVYVKVYKILSKIEQKSEKMVYILEMLMKKIQMPPELEEKLRNAINSECIADMKHQLLIDLCNLIEESADYSEYRKELSEQVKKVVE